MYYFIKKCVIYLIERILKYFNDEILMYMYYYNYVIEIFIIVFKLVIRS